jgi:hypothetical protein
VTAGAGALEGDGREADKDGQSEDREQDEADNA